MKKHTILLLLFMIILSLLVTGCQQNNQDIESPTPTNTATPSSTPTKELTTANIAGLKGPTSMGMIRMFAELNSLSEYVSVEFDVYSSPDVITAGLLNGEIDIAAIPTNMAAILYNKTEGDIVLLGVNTLGVLNIVTRDTESINSLADLTGKKIVASGQGLTPEYILNYLLTQNGIDPTTDVTIEYKAEHSEVAAMLLSRQADIVLLPQPFVTSVLVQDEHLINAIDLTNEWETIEGEKSALMMGCLVTTREFADAYASELTSLMMLNAESATWVNENPESAAKFIVQFEILPSEIIAMSAIPESNITFIFAQQVKEQLNGYFQVLFNYNPESVGGVIPKDDFYFGQ